MRAQDDTRKGGTREARQGGREGGREGGAEEVPEAGDGWMGIRRDERHVCG